LREGEQFANAFFTLETKIKIAKAYVFYNFRFPVHSVWCAGEKWGIELELY
jgi:hypothetical protein